ncbi:MAG: hypothetical protein IT164_06070 [Bryobacterales bacterium]|nr:hypothetical protein [Bryobacterales bacterium]
MPLRVSALLLACCVAAMAEVPASVPAPVNFSVAAGDGGSWPRILSSMGVPRAAGDGGILVLTGAVTEPESWRRRVAQGAFLILEGASPVAEVLGIVSTGKRSPARSVADAGSPELDIIWEERIDLPLFEMPAQARIFARERWSGAPLVAGWRQGAGAVLWTAVSPGKRGYERFPYLPQALHELGVQPVAGTRSLWAFFDSSYRSRADLDYFAQRWRQAGIGALHVAAWHYWEPDAARDAYLKRLIEACHRRAIHVYAWIEFPHVSQKFWDSHPEWREQTAIGQDAHLDWRRLMNLQNPGAKREIASGLRNLATRFDWDGVNLAELYFESLEGHANASRFTPMNADVRAEFTSLHGFDPRELFDADSPRHHTRNAGGLRKLIEFRAALAQRMQGEWLDELERIRESRPHLDLVLTHVDDRFDTRMRDLIGADAGRLLPVLERRDATFLIEDPATVWHLGPERYPEIAARYRAITERPARLAIDINIVERYQNVYPTKKQTGSELFQLVHLAAGAFPRVALYFESSLLPRDLPLLAAAGSRVDAAFRAGPKLALESSGPVAVPWSGPARVNGRPWPAAGASALMLPAGTFTIEPAQQAPSLTVLDLAADLTSAAVDGRSVEIGYQAQARAWTLLDRRPARAELDGAPFPLQPVALDGGVWLVELPRGQHLVTLFAE